MDMFAPLDHVALALVRPNAEGVIVLVVLSISSAGNPFPHRRAGS
jgi:hypothetical protein